MKLAMMKKHLLCMIGRKYDDPIIQEEKKTWPFKVVCGDGNVPMYEVQINGQTQKFSLVDISAKILTEMKSIAEEFFGEDVKRAVITVPADFNPTQKEEAIMAGKLACFNDIWLLDEPTATAIAYFQVKKIVKYLSSTLVAARLISLFSKSLLLRITQLFPSSM